LSLTTGKLKVCSTMNDVRLVVFDCDGTLVDGHGLLMDALNLAYQGADVEAPDTLQVRQKIGLPLQTIIADLTPALSLDQCAHIAEKCIGHLHQLRDEDSYAEPLYPKVKETIAALDQLGFVLGIATGKGIRGLNHVLKAHGMAQYFTTLQTPHNSPGKPHPGMLENAMDATGARPENTVMIGDTTFDMEMAINAGITAIGVDWGYHEVGELHAAGAHKVIGSMTDLHQILEGTG